MMKLIQFVLAAVLLLASPFAFAAKPLKNQEINSGPVWQGNVLGCWVSNQTDATIIADITIYYYDPTTKNTESVLFEEVEIGPNSVIRRDRIGSNRGGYCQIAWTGNVGELRGNFCGFYVDATDNSEFLGCSDAY